MKTYREYVAEMDLSKEKPDYSDIIDKRQQVAPGKGNPPQPQQVAPGKGSLPASSATKPPIPKLRPKVS